MRPLPSRYGWMVSNCTCRSPARTSGGRVSSAWRYRAATAAHQPLVRLAQEAHRKRQALGIGELGARVGERVEVVANLFDVGVGGGALLCAGLGLEREQVDERRLCSFDLRREDGLLAHEGVDEPVERRNHLPGQLEANERSLGCAEALGQGGVDHDGWIRGRQRVRDEDRDLLATYAGPFVSSGGSFGHRWLSSERPADLVRTPGKPA